MGVLGADGLAAPPLLLVLSLLYEYSWRVLSPFVYFLSFIYFSCLFSDFRVNPLIAPLSLAYICLIFLTPLPLYSPKTGKLKITLLGSYPSLLPQKFNENMEIQSLCPDARHSSFSVVHDSRFASFSSPCPSVPRSGIIFPKLLGVDDSSRNGVCFGRYLMFIARNWLLS